MNEQFLIFDNLYIFLLSVFLPLFFCIIGTLFYLLSKKDNKSKIKKKIFIIFSNINFVIVTLYTFLYIGGIVLSKLSYAYLNTHFLFLLLIFLSTFILSIILLCSVEDKRKYALVCSIVLSLVYLYLCFME